MGFFGIAIFKKGHQKDIRAVIVAIEDTGLENEMYNPCIPH